MKRTVRQRVIANTWDSLIWQLVKCVSCQWVQICQDHAHVQWEACCIWRGLYAFPQERQATLWDIKPLQNVRLLPATSGVCILTEAQRELVHYWAVFLSPAQWWRCWEKAKLSYWISATVFEFLSWVQTQLWDTRSEKQQTFGTDCTSIVLVEEVVEQKQSLSQTTTLGKFKWENMSDIHQYH